jgi:hypothetical protein
LEGITAKHKKGRDMGPGLPESETACGACYFSWIIPVIRLLATF